MVRLSASRTSRLYPQEMFLVLIFTRGWVDPRVMVRSEGICHWKIQWHQAGIDPGTVRLVAQRLNNYATPGPFSFLLTSHIQIDTYDCLYDQNIHLLTKFRMTDLDTLPQLGCAKIRSYPYENDSPLWKNLHPKGQRQVWHAMILNKRIPITNFWLIQKKRVTSSDTKLRSWVIRSRCFKAR